MLTDDLNAIDPSYAGFVSPQQQMAAEKVKKLTNPFGFAQDHLGPPNSNGLHPINDAGMKHLQSFVSGMPIADNSNLIGKGLANNSSAIGMSNDVQSMSQPQQMKGFFGQKLDEAKDKLKSGLLDFATGGAYSAVHNKMNDTSKQIQNSLFGKTKQQQQQPDYYDTVGNYSNYS